MKTIAKHLRYTFIEAFIVLFVKPIRSKRRNDTRNKSTRLSPQGIVSLSWNTRCACQFSLFIFVFLNISLPYLNEFLFKISSSILLCYFYKFSSLISLKRNIILLIKKTYFQGSIISAAVTRTDIVRGTANVDYATGLFVSREE